MSQHHHHGRHRHHSSSSSFTSCFFASTTADHHHLSALSLPPPPPPPPPPTSAVSGKPNLTTCLYQTHLGQFSLTWSRSFLGHSLHLDLQPFDFSTPCSSSSLSTNSPSLSTLCFHLHIKPFLFWKKHGSKKLSTNSTATNSTASASASSAIRIFWDLSRAKFGSGPEPQSGFYIAVVFDGEMTLLVGDATKEAYSKTKAQKTPRTNQFLVLRREHVVGNKVYTTKAKFGGKTREISIDCSSNSDAKLLFNIDNKRVLQVKRLKWKFRGNERVEVDGVPIQVSWDVHNWLFEDSNINNNGHAVFMFRFENLDNNEEDEVHQQQQANIEEVNNEKDGVVSWQRQQQQLQQTGSCSFGMNGIEWKKMMRKSVMRTARSSSLSSISMSSASSSGCSSSVMEWASSEESELCPGFHGFSLLVYVWKK